MADRRIYSLDELEAMAAPDGTRGDYRSASACRAHRDGDCFWAKCPQIADDEPNATGRHCPLDEPPFRAGDEDE
jgi:hypothetical protein